MRIERQPLNEFELEPILRAELLAELAAEATSQVVSIEPVESEEKLPLSEAA